MLLLAACLLTLTPSATLGPVPKDQKAPAKLVGSWKLVKSSQGIEKGTSLEVEFAADGKMIVRQKGADNSTESYEGKYEKKEGEIPYTLKLGDFEKSETLTIKKLTDEELIVVDPDGIQEEFSRIKPVKKEGEKKEEKKEEKKPQQ